MSSAPGEPHTERFECSFADGCRREGECEHGTRERRLCASIGEPHADTKRLDKLERRLKAHFALRPACIEVSNWCGPAGIRVNPTGTICITSIGDKDARYALRDAIDAMADPPVTETTE